jgi:hypothetical protein
MEAAAGLAINSAGAFQSSRGVCLLIKQACLVVP